MRQGPNRRRGYTLLEGMVVVAILGIVSVASFSLWGAYHRDTLLGAESDKIAKALSTARGYAVANNTRYQVTFWPQEMVYWIDETNSSDTVVTPKVTTPERMDGLVEIDSIVGGISTFSATCVSLRFYPDGTSDSATIYVIEKTADHSDDAQFYTIRLYAPTGKAVVFENEKL